MKLTLRQLETTCRTLNQTLAATPYGYFAEREGDSVAILRVSRQHGRDREPVFIGSVREAAAFLSGVAVGVAVLPPDTGTKWVSLPNIDLRPQL